MKRLIAIGMIGMVLAIMAVPSLKVINFYQNQAEIIASHCINKEKPKLKCGGHCYLKKQLTEDTDQPEESNFPEIEIFTPISSCIHSEIVVETVFYSNTKAVYAAINGSVTAYISDVFTPPKLFI